MGMIKVIQPHAQDFSEPVAAMIKLSSRGIIGADKQEFVKRAGAELVEKAADIKFFPGEIPVHLIAIGATEDYGPNRNGDGFTRATCRKDHSSFEKLARFYRDHANKNPAKSFGTVKASYYNEPMRRIELICALNGTKEAAVKNGGLLADRELEKLSSGKDIPVSMACKIPFDLCSACGNKARTRAEYCDSVENGGRCKAGGLKHNIGKVLEDGHILHADNTKCAFFDISHVFRPADRIAYVSGELQKAASAGVISGAELAEHLGVTMAANLDREFASKYAAQQFHALQQLAGAESSPALGDAWVQVCLSSSAPVQAKIDVNACEFAKMSEVIRGLADAGVVLSVRDFLALTVKSANDELVDSVVAALPNVFTNLIEDPNIETILEDNPFYPAKKASSSVKMWAEKIAQTHSMLTPHIEKRAYLAAIRAVNPPALNREKRSAAPAENALAKHYALYKIATFTAAREKYSNNLLTATHCVLQNYVT